MMTAQRLCDIRRFHDLWRAGVEEGAPPLLGVQRRVLIDMMAELLQHAEQTVEQTVAR